MSNEAKEHDIGAIRSQLLGSFTAETLPRFCRDRPTFRPILQYFGAKYHLHDMVEQVLEYCEANLLFDELLVELEGYDPGQYAATAPVITTPFNLPADLADFTGRGAEIAEVRERLHRDGTLAISGIHGMGGIGKTVLALHVLHQLAAEGRFRDAQLYLDLKGTDPQPVSPVAALDSLLSALLGPDPRRPRDVDALSELWRRVIHGKDAVLLLDNAAGASQVRPLLPGCATCAVVVTSRQRFKLEGASLLDLRRMEKGEARGLLQRLAPRLDDGGADAIAELCGCLPLALRIAGNYMGLNDDCTPGEYQALLADERARLERLRDPEDRDLDVRAAISLSVAQLDADTRRAWGLMALFPAPFDLAAVAALWAQGGEAAARERLGALRNRSLVSYDVESGRYYQHDLLRIAAGQELVDAGEGAVPAARERLAGHFLAVAEEVRDTQRFLDLDADWPHLRAALEYAAGAEVGLLSDLTYALANYFAARGLAHDKIAWCQRAADACAGAGRQRDAGAHLGNLGLAYKNLGEVRKAIEYHERALAIAQEIGDRRGEGAQLGNLGIAYYELGEVRRAIEYHEQALAISKEIGDRRGEGSTLGNLGLVYAQLGETLRAIEAYEQALAISKEIGDRRGEGIALGNLGSAYRRLGEVQQALKYYEQQRTITEEIGYRRGEGRALWGLGNVYADLGDKEQAIASYEQAIELLQAIEDPNVETVRGLLARLDE